MKYVRVNDEQPLIFEHNMALYVHIEAEIAEETGLITKMSTDVKISDDVTIPFDESRQLAMDALEAFRVAKESE